MDVLSVQPHFLRNAQGSEVKLLLGVYWLRHMYKKYILEKKWSKTTIPALSSGQTENDTPIWGRRHQLDEYMSNEYKSNYK